MNDEQNTHEQSGAQINEVFAAAENTISTAMAGAGAVPSGGPPPPLNNPADQFVGLPIESLICAPILAAAKGQQELTAVYVETIKKLAYKDGNSGAANVLEFDMQRPVVQQDGSMSQQSYKVQAPLISLVPVPAFVMDELVVDFDMEVKESTLQEDTVQKEASANVNFKSWFGLNASISGKVTSSSTQKRETDSSATYKIHARALQQPPSEGMAKLTSLFAQGMEPLVSGKS